MWATQRLFTAFVKNSYLLQPLHILHQEAIGVVPGQEDVLQHVAHAFLFETQVLRSNHGRVDQVQPAQGNSEDSGKCGDRVTGRSQALARTGCVYDCGIPLNPEFNKCVIIFGVKSAVVSVTLFRKTS